MSILRNAPGRFWAFSDSNTTEGELTVGTSDVSYTVQDNTRVILLDVDGSVYFNPGSAATTDSYPLPSGQYEFYVEGGTTLHFIADAAGQELTFLEIAQ